MQTIHTTRELPVRKVKPSHEVELCIVKTNLLQHDTAHLPLFLLSGLWVEGMVGLIFRSV